MTFKIGALTPPKMSKFYRVEYTSHRKGQDPVTVLLSTRYAMNAKEKQRAHRKADDINRRWDKNDPSYQRPKWKHRRNSIIHESARVVIKAEQTGNAMPVYL